MREIKFRAWDKINKTMDMHAHNRAWFGPRVSHGDTREFEVMQYTGLKDRNGVEIFEGDIIQTHPDTHLVDSGYKAKVIYEPTRFILDAGGEGRIGMWFGKTKDEQLEVIGNIYEHSHLLESQGSVQR